MPPSQTDRIHQALDSFRIELPSWGFANTGTRFGKFLQPAAATSIEEKFSDAAEVHRWTGVCPTLALHVLWDLPQGIKSIGEVQNLAARYGKVLDFADALNALGKIPQNVQREGGAYAGPAMDFGSVAEFFLDAGCRGGLQELAEARAGVGESPGG